MDWRGLGLWVSSNGMKQITDKEEDKKKLRVLSDQVENIKILQNRI